MNYQDYRNALFENGQLGPFPTHRLRRVDKPTTMVTDSVQRIDARESAIARGRRGDFGAIAQREQPRGSTKHPLSAAQIDVVCHLAAIKDNEVAACKAPISEDPKTLSLHIKRLGYFSKADIVGICRIPEYAVYSHDLRGNPLDIDYQYAIVIVVSKECETVKASKGSDWIGGAISFQAYVRAASIVHTLANYIRRLGYDASAQHVSPGPNDRYQVLVPPLLLWAGIGEVSRAGIILNPFLGLNFKAAVVLTNMPLEPDKPIDFGLQDFCQHCGICTEACPSKAIPMGDKVMYNGYETWKLDERRCGMFWLTNQKGTGCNRCIKVCPWTRPNTLPNNMVRWAVKRSSLARRLAVKADHILDRRKANEKDKWWFDLEEVDRVLRIPYTNDG